MKWSGDWKGRRESLLKRAIREEKKPMGNIIKGEDLRGSFINKLKLRNQRSKVCIQ